MEQGILRHYLAAIGYRAGKAFAGVLDQYIHFSIGQGVRSPIEILNHMCNVLTKAVKAFGHTHVNEKEVTDWDTEVERFYSLLEDLDNALEKGKTPKTLSMEQIVQGPLADVMTHIGQLYTLRRLSGFPVVTESFIKADIQAGKIRYLS